MASQQHQEAECEDWWEELVGTKIDIVIGIGGTTEVLPSPSIL
jgi:hypothetical protein